jgi:hypothetical protein
MRQVKFGLSLAELRFPPANLPVLTVQGIDGRGKQPVNARRRVRTRKNIDDRVRKPPWDVRGPRRPGMRPGLGCPRTSTTGYATRFGMSPDLDDRVCDPVWDVPGHHESGMQPGLGCPGTSTTGYARWVVMSKKDSYVQYRCRTPAPRTRRRGLACRRHETGRPTWPCEPPMVGRRLGSLPPANRRWARAHPRRHT